MKKMTINDYKIEVKTLNLKVDELLTEKRASIVERNQLIKDFNDLKFEKNSLQEQVIKLQNYEIVLVNDINKEKTVTRYEQQGREKELNDKLYNAEKIIKSLMQNQSQFIQNFTGIYL